ncbi:MAG: succinate dehydrogenase, cytochrome b556 subunit [Pseudomonadota bacterium]
MSNKKRPKHLDLLRIKLPVPGIVSILHRVSGALLFLLIPALLYAFQQSLASPESYAGLKAFFGFWLVKLALIGVLWAFLHHLLAGLRYLAIDLHYGVALQPARASAKAVLALSLILTAVAGVALW